MMMMMIRREIMHLLYYEMEERARGRAGARDTSG